MISLLLCTRAVFGGQMGKHQFHGETFVFSGDVNNDLRAILTSSCVRSNYRRTLTKYVGAIFDTLVEIYR